MSKIGKVCVDYRIKSHAPPLVQAPVSSFEFQSYNNTSQAECLLCKLKNLKNLI